MPDWSKEISAAIASLHLEPSREAEVIEELSQHLRDRYDEMLLAGVEPEQAHQILTKELHDGKLISGLEATMPAAKEHMSLGTDSGENLFAGVGSDLRYGVRLLLRSPGFAIVAILLLALGIGANTTIFQLLDAVRMRTLPVQAPQQLATVRIVNSPRCCRGDHFSGDWELTGALWQAVKEQQQGFSEIAAWAPARSNLNYGGEARYADTLMVSGDFFSVLGLQPVLGRLISPADDYKGCGNQAVVLSYAFWQREFGGRPDALGGKVSLDGHPFQVIGITPPAFSGLVVGQKFDVAIPLCSQAVFSNPPLMDRDDAWWLATIGRLKPGWTLERASAQLDAISPGILAATVPSNYDAIATKDYRSFHIGALPAATGMSWLRKDYDDPLGLLLTLSGLVLLIACANLANLMLARAGARQREMALRLTLGASRARLLRQLLAESLLLAAMGTVAGVLLAQILSRAMVAFLTTQQSPIYIQLAPDWRVLGFAAVLAILTCILFGLVPAIKASHTEPGAVMKTGGHGSTAGHDRFVLRRALVVTQVALSLVLLTAAFMFVRSFRNIIHVNAGFQQNGILVTYIDFSQLKLPKEREMSFQQELFSRVRAIPGVASAAQVLMVPLSHSGWDNNIDIPDGPQRQDVTLNRISPGYFNTMETPLLAGRDFNQTDLPAAPRTAIVNQAFARKFYGGNNPIGRVFHDTDPPGKTYQIIGVVQNSKFYDLREAPVPTVYVSFTQANGPDDQSTLVIRSDEPLLPLISSINRAVTSFNPALVLNFVVLKTEIRDGLLRERLMATLSGFFGFLAAILAMVGLYGVMSYMVVQRRNEIGVRIALGADRSNILLMIVREAATLLATGLLVGTCLALAAGTAAASLVYGLKPRDPLTLAAAIAGMAIVGLAASLLPAQRAASMNPMTALREE